MKKEIAMQWIEALTSGKYSQGQGALRTFGTVSRKNKFCCLGVLCDLSNLHSWREGMSGLTETYGGSDGVPPHSVHAWAGLSLHSAILLAGMNDEEGASFEEVAEYIELNWEKL